MNKLSPFKWFCLQNFPFIEADFDALTNYELMCKVYEYVSKIAVKTNELGEEVEALAHYIENLDIQDEVDKKLDEMAESGELAEIMAGYLNQRAIFSFDSVSDMKQAENLVAGSFTETYGYYENGDLGGAKYYIREVTNQDDVNDMDIIAIGTGNLVAEIVLTSDELNIKQFGAKCDGSTDDSDIIQHCADYLKTKYQPANQWRSIPIELSGNYKECKITKTLYFPHNLRVKGLYIELYDGNYDGNYAIKVNVAPGETNWLVANPRQTVGYMKECRIYNKTQNDYKGILNASNNTFSAIQCDNLAESYRTTGDYLDSQNIEKFHVTNKRDTSDYAIYTGFLGDLVRIKDVAIDGYTEGHTYNNALYVGQGHNGCIIDGAIIHGSVYLGASNVTMTNLHFELGHILAHGTALKITNAFMYHEPPTIELEERASAVLENIRFIYRFYHYTYANMDDVDVKLSANCECNIIDCYKFIVGNTISTNIRGNIVVLQNNVRLISNGMKQQYFGVWSKRNQTYPFPGGLNDGVVDSSGGFVKWNADTGTYYYRFVKMIDFERNLGYGSYSKTFNVSLTNGQGGMRATAMYKGSKWRVYRGTESGTYDKICEYSHNIGDCLDNGFMVNGFKWSDRTAGDVDSINSISNNTLTKYDENDNIICHMASTPTSGTWKVDDIVITSTKVYRCTNGANGGTWVEV